MEKTVADLADLVKKMREDRLVYREADREAINSLKKALEDNTTVMKDVVGWRTVVDSKMDDLQLSVKKLNNKVEEIALHQEEADNPAYKVFDREHLDLSKPAAAHLAASSSQAASGQFCHRVDDYYRGTGQGVVTTLVPTPVKGEKPYSEFTPLPMSLRNVSENLTTVTSNFNVAMPQLPFPVFDGNSPKLWKKKCENYFDIYEVPTNVWVKLAVMNFQGSAEFWLQSLDHPYNEFSWKELCDAICTTPSVSGYKARSNLAQSPIIIFDS
ncbi:unnamed protein product [Urochloa humidicola]